MTEHERYLLDLQGFLVIPNALSGHEIASINSVIDSRIDAEVQAEANTHRFVGLLSWGQPFIDLIDNPAVMPYLTESVHPQVRLDHDYLDVIRTGKGPIGTTLHGGATPYDPLYSYHYENGRIRNGLSVIAYNLHDVGPTDGGFGCVPGSHKSNIAFPEDWKDLDQAHSIVQAVTGPAGTAILFSEALTHGTLPWHGKHDRRTVFYKYSPCGMSWAADFYDADDYPTATDAQRAILESPNARYPRRHTNGY